MIGLEVDDLAYYLQRPDKYDVAVKRFEADWFTHRNESGISGAECVLNLALKKVEENQGSPSRWRYVRRFLRQIKLLLPQPGGNRDPATETPVNVTAYTCSGFVQWCYYQSVFNAVQQKHLDISKLGEAIFNPRLSGLRPGGKDLLSTTPGDLDRSENLSWKYVVRDGSAWEVSSRREVRQVLGHELSC